MPCVYSTAVFHLLTIGFLEKAPDDYRRLGQLAYRNYILEDWTRLTRAYGAYLVPTDVSDCCSLY